MGNSLFLTFDQKMQIVSTIDNLIIAKRLFDSGLSLPENTNFIGRSNDYGEGGSLFEKGVSFLFESDDFVYADPPTEDAAHAFDFRFAFEFQSPLVQKWQALVLFFAEKEEIQKQHTQFESSIAEIWCDDFVEMCVRGEFIPGGLRVTILGFDRGYFHELFEDYLNLAYEIKASVLEWSNRRVIEEVSGNDEVA